MEVLPLQWILLQGLFISVSIRDQFINTLSFHTLDFDKFSSVWITAVRTFKIPSGLLRVIILLSVNILSRKYYHQFPWKQKALQMMEPYWQKKPEWTIFCLSQVILYIDTQLLRKGGRNVTIISRAQIDQNWIVLGSHPS